MEEIHRRVDDKEASESCSTRICFHCASVGELINYAPSSWTPFVKMLQPPQCILRRAQWVTGTDKPSSDEAPRLRFFWCRKVSLRSFAW
jgi:hypothetical protein